MAEVDPSILLRGRARQGGGFGSQVSQFVELERGKRRDALAGRMLKLQEDRAAGQKAEADFNRIKTGIAVAPKGSDARRGFIKQFYGLAGIDTDSLNIPPKELDERAGLVITEIGKIRGREAKGEISGAVAQQEIKGLLETTIQSFQGQGFDILPRGAQDLTARLERLQVAQAGQAQFEREQAGKVEIANIKAGGKAGAAKDRRKAARQRQIGTVAGRIARTQTAAEQKASTAPVLGPDGEPLTEFSLDPNKGLIQVPKTEVVPLTVERRAEIEAESLKAAKALVPKLRGGKGKTKAKDVPITQPDGSFAPTDDLLTVAGQTLISAIRLRQAGDIEGDPLSDSFIEKVLEDAGVDVSTPEKLDAAQNKVVDLLKQLQQSRTQ